VGIRAVGAGIRMKDSRQQAQAAGWGILLVVVNIQLVVAAGNLRHIAAYSVVEGSQPFCFNYNKLIYSI